ncbi:MAG: sigma-70 family RNA polymerase sigma factor [Planctomycetota bacterium]
MSENQDEQEIIQRLNCGDQSALTELYDRYRSRLKRLVELRLSPGVKQRIDASDVLQESFIDLAKKLPDFKTKDMSPYVWLRLVVTERVLDLHRKHLYAEKRDVRREVGLRAKPAHDATSFSLAHALLGDDTSVSEKVAREERQKVLMQKLEELEENDKEIILMRTFEHLSNDESAEILGLTKYAASKRYIRALKKALRDLRFRYQLRCDLTGHGQG